jgi:hypothetical protein
MGHQMERLSLCGKSGGSRLFIVIEIDGIDSLVRGSGGQEVKEGLIAGYVVEVNHSPIAIRQPNPYTLSAMRVGGGQPRGRKLTFPILFVDHRHTRSLLCIFIIETNFLSKELHCGGIVTGVRRRRTDHTLVRDYPQLFL